MVKWAQWLRVKAEHDDGDDDTSSSVPGAVNYIGAFFVVVMMTGMGATVELAALRTVFAKRRGVLIGLGSQLLVMPLLAYAFAHLLDMEPGQSVGLILIGSSPGGTLSNLATYVGGGDMLLGLTMTAVTNLLAVATLPLLLFIYASDSEVTIPYGIISLSLAATVLPIFFGMYLRKVVPHRAKLIERVGAITGGSVIAIGGLVVLIRNGGGVAKDLGWKTPLGCALVSMSGGAFGFLASKLARLHHRERLTIVLETGVQNAATAIAVVSISFDEPERTTILLVPVFYGFLTFFESAAVVGAYVWWRRRRRLGDPLHVQLNEVGEEEPVEAGHVE